MQMYAADLTPLADPVSLPPAEAAARIGGAATVGSGLARLAALLPPGRDALPDARHIGLLPPALVDLDPRPLYGRAPDAKLPAARMMAS